MANAKHPGFAPVSTISGGTVTYRRHRVLTNNTTIIALNDAVIATAAGDAVVATAINTAIMSVSGGASYVDSTGARIGAKSLPAATLYTGTLNDQYNASFINVVDNTFLTKFRCSIDTAILQTDLVNNYAMTLTASTNGISNHELASAAHGTTATLPWRVREFIFTTENDTEAADVHVLAMINAGMAEPALEVGGSIGT
jgi:hypothetical protein